MSDDQAWQQVQELAQAGKMDEAVVLYETNVIKPSNPIDAALRPHVKKTADELPEPTVDVLIWNGSAWIQAWYDDDEDDWTIEGDCDYPLSLGQYWLPLPTFNPESEG